MTRSCFASIAFGLVAFWTYENWVHKYARVHRGTCPHCNDGQGNHDAVDSHVGRWLGPYERYDLAYSAATGTGLSASACGHCVPG